MMTVIHHVLAYLREVFAGHLRQDIMEVCLVLIVNESVMENSESLVTEKSEYLFVVSHISHITLQNTCNTHNKSIKVSIYRGEQNIAHGSDAEDRIRWRSLIEQGAKLKPSTAQNKGGERRGR